MRKQKNILCVYAVQCSGYILYMHTSRVKSQFVVSDLIVIIILCFHAGASSRREHNGKCILHFLPARQ